MEIWRLPHHQLSPDNRRHRKWIKRHVYTQNQTITPGRLLKFFWQHVLNQSADIIQLLQRHTSLAGRRKLNMTQSLLQSDLDSEQIRWSGLTPDLVPHLLKGPLTTSTKYTFGCRRNWSKCQLEWFAFILLPFCTIYHQLWALQPPTTSALSSYIFLLNLWRCFFHITAKETQKNSNLGFNLIFRNLNLFF